MLATAEQMEAVMPGLTISISGYAQPLHLHASG